MRAVKNLDDAILVLRELSDWKDVVSTKGLDLRGTKITGGSKATEAADYVRLDQVPTINEKKELIVPIYYTIIFSSDGTVSPSDVIPSFITGYGREAVPHQLWLMARTAPTGGSLDVNVVIRTIGGASDLDVTTQLLATPLSFPAAGTRRVITSTFANPLPKLSTLSEVYPTIEAGNNAAVVSIGLVVKLL